MIEIGTLLQDRYLVEKQIGAGGMGAVYLAVDKRFDNYLAIKETFFKDEQLAEAFEREARLLNSLMHPVLPHVSDYFAENNGYFLVMQYIEGEDLSDILKLEGAFPVEDVLRWADNLLDALDYLHSQEPPIIHRDIKPHNLKLTRRRDIMLLDFGLAKLNYEDTAGAISVFGFSRTYSPLEQIQGTGTDARSDIFALGATVYHLLTGKPPINALNRAAAIINGKPDPIKSVSEMNPQVPAAIANIINSALALNPDQRFVSAKAMRQALEFAAAAAVAAATEKAFEKNLEPRSASSGDAATATAAAPVVHYAETENFPALEAFAAEVEKNTSAVEDNNAPPPSAPEVLDQNNKNEFAEPENFPNTTAVVEAPTRANAPRRNRKPTAFTALAAALILLGAAASLYFFAAGKNSADEVNQAPASQENPASSNNEMPENISDLPTLLPETARQNKAKPVAIDKTTEKRRIDLEPVAIETAEKSRILLPPAAAAVISAPAQQQKQTATAAASSASSAARRRKEAKNNGETRSRIVVEPPTPSDASQIESVFTGKKAADRQNKVKRNPNDMSDEDFEQLRRERKQKRLERRSNSRPYLPF